MDWGQEPRDKPAVDRGHPSMDRGHKPRVSLQWTGVAL